MRLQQIVLVALLGLGLFAAGAVYAQETVDLERLEVVIWPEYDRPEALVMLRGFLPADTIFPATVILPMPASTTINAVAKRVDDGRLILADYSRQVQGDWVSLSIVSDVPEVRLEYYMPLALNDAERRLVFSWPGGVDVGDVAYEVQQPYGAEDLVVTPAPDRQQSGFDGLTYHHASLGSKSALDTFSIEITYTKATSDLTIAALRPAAPPGGTPQAANPPDRTTPPAQFPWGELDIWLILVPIVCLAGLIVIWFVLSSPKRNNRKQI
jgi:hypothetical protein